MESSFGKWLFTAREKAGLTQKELADAAGISPNYISALERNEINTKDGKPRTPRIDKVEKIGRALGVPIDEIRIAAGYAPISEIKIIRERIRVSDFDGFDDKDLDDIAEYIALKKLKNERKEKD